MIHEALMTHSLLANTPQIREGARAVLAPPTRRWLPNLCRALTAALVAQGVRVTSPFDVMRRAGTLDRNSIAYAREATRAVLDCDLVILPADWRDDPGLISTAALAEALGKDTVPWEPVVDLATFKAHRDRCTQARTG